MPGFRLPHPTTFVRSSIQDASVKKAFDKGAYDVETPNQFTKAEVAALFEAASRDNPYVNGDSTTARELGDLKMIREKGAWMLASPGAQALYDEKLAALEAKPKLGWKDNDASLRSQQVALNKVAITGTAAGFVTPGIHRIVQRSTVSIEVDGQSFSVKPEPKASSAKIAKQLAEALIGGGYEAKVDQKAGVTTVEVVGKAGAASFPNMSYQALAGTVKSYPEGTTPPYGSGKNGEWLVLDKPISIDGAEVKQLFLHGGRAKDGEQVTLNGRLELQVSPFEIHPPIHYAVLSGVTNLGAGEPRFDGKDFYDAAGTKLNRGSYYPPHVMDIPSTIYLFDHAASRVHEAKMGGFIPPWMNPFHGIRETAKMLPPSAAEAGVRWKLGSQVPTNAEGKALIKVGSEPMGLASKDWFIDADKNTLYAFVPTTRRGPDRADLAHVVKLDGQAGF